MRIHLLFMLLSLIGCVKSTVPSPPIVTKEKLSIEIVPHNSTKENGASLHQWHPFYLLIKNNTNSNITIWKEWCSWGYFAPSFKIKFENGQQHILKKKDITWTRNFPATFVIKPYSHYVIPVNIRKDYKWEPIFINYKNQIVSIQAFYKIDKTKEQKEQKEQNVWLGEVSSPIYKFRINN